MAVTLGNHASGVILPVKALAGARRNGITGVHDGALKVAVSQAPEKGKANAAIMDVLADALGLRARQIELLTGQTNPFKQFLIRDISLDELAARIEKILAEHLSSS